MAKSNIIPAISGAKKKTLSANSSFSLETIPLSHFSFLKYFISFVSLNDGTTKQMEVQIKKQGSNVYSVVSGRIGTGIDLIVNPLVSGVNFEMSITNNESFDVEINYSNIII